MPARNRFSHVQILVKGVDGCLRLIVCAPSPAKSIVKPLVMTTRSLCRRHSGRTEGFTLSLFPFAQTAAKCKVEVASASDKHEVTNK